MDWLALGLLLRALLTPCHADLQKARMIDASFTSFNAKYAASEAQRQAQGISTPEWGLPYEVGGEGGVDFMYEGVYWKFPEEGGSGLSYYLRAFDMFPNYYANELGWGQWIGTRGENPADGPCSLNPRILSCFKEEDVEYWGDNPANFEKELKDCTWPEDNDELLQCKIDDCAFTDGYPIYGQFEGGMGYWPYMTEASGVKWMVPAAVSGYYSKFGAAFLNEFHQPCTNLGGAIQVSNNILLAPDGYSFEPNSNGDVDGMLGYMLQRTPIGKMHADDNRNYWTIIVDTENFQGPLVYSSAYHWEHPNSWRPEIRTWADHDVKIGGGSEGTEGRVGVTAVESDGYYWFRMQDVDMHLDRDGEALTVTSNHVRYDTDWADMLENVLDGTQPTMIPSDVKAAAKTAGVKPACIARGESDEVWGQFYITGDPGPGEFPFSAGYTVRGWGVGDSRVPGTDDEADSEWCHSRIPIDTSNPNLTCDTNKCRLTPYFKIPVDARLSPNEAVGELIPESDMPSGVKAAIDARAIELWEGTMRWNDGEYLDGPDKDQEVCFDNPGPTDPKLYCRRTTDKRWLAYKWYRFVDQPEMNQVIGSLPEEQQEEATCFMQARIERLHEMQAKEDKPRWFEPPTELPAERVTIDQGFLVTPPLGLEVGYVPVSVYSKLREKPFNCDVVEGELQEEPSPLPENYFTTPDWFGSGYDRYPETCALTDFSGDTFDIPGTIYLSTLNGSGDKYPWKVPKRAEVVIFVPKAYKDLQCAVGSGPNPSPTPDPTNAPASTGGGFCFSEYDTVQVNNKGTIPMKELRIGDLVLTSSNIYEAVYSFGHYNPELETEFIRITTSSSCSKPLEISKQHMLFVKGKAIPASLVKEGDLLSMTTPSSSSTVRVEKVGTVLRKGVYAPFTASGTIVVNGVLASTFIAFQDSDVVMLGGRIRTPLTFHWLAHMFEFPHRTICSVAPKWCQREQYSSTGISLWVYVPFKVTEWSFANFPVLSTVALLLPTTIRAWSGLRTKRI